MVFKTTSTKSRSRGFTIVEFLVGSLIAVALLAQVCALWFYSSRSFASQMAYVELDQKSQRALDVLTRDVRQVKGLVSFEPCRVRFTDVNDLPLEYEYSNRTLTRRVNNGPRQVLLTECDGLNFTMYQRTPQAGSWAYYPTSDPAVCKMVEVRWICSRKLFPTAPTTTESVQAAKIVLRSHKTTGGSSSPTSGGGEILTGGGSLDITTQ